MTRLCNRLIKVVKPFRAVPLKTQERAKAFNYQGGTMVGELPNHCEVLLELFGGLCDNVTSGCWKIKRSMNSEDWRPMNELKPDFADSATLSFDDMSPDPSWAFPDTTASKSHKWNYYRYPSRTSPRLLEGILDTYLRKPFSLVNDPFIGSGTTAVTAISRCHYVSGTDINPFATVLTGTRALPLEPDILRHRVDSFLSRTSYLGFDEEAFLKDYTVSLIPADHESRIDFWFPEEMKLLLGKILRHIQTEKDLEFRSFLQVAFSHILKGCSWWARGSMTPVRHLNKKLKSPMQELSHHLQNILQGNEMHWRNIPAEVRKEPARFLTVKAGDCCAQPLEDECIDMVVTDVPQVHTYEFADLHQLPLLWLSLVENFQEHRREYIGTGLKRGEEVQLSSPAARQFVQEMEEVSSPAARQLEAYYSDMKEAFDESLRILKRGGRGCYIVKNTQLKRQIVRNAEILVQILHASGFEIEKIIKRPFHANNFRSRNRDTQTGKFVSASAGTGSGEFIIIARKPQATSR